MAAALVFELHGCALRQLSDSCEMHFVGLSQAARVARRRGKLSDKLAAKLTKVDVAFALLRHITSFSVESTIHLLVDELICSQVSVQEEALVADSGTAPGGMPCRPGPPQRGSSVRADCDIRSGVPARVPPEVLAPPASDQLIQNNQVDFHLSVDQQVGVPAVLEASKNPFAGMGGNIFGVQLEVARQPPEVTAPPTSAQFSETRCRFRRENHEFVKTRFDPRHECSCPGSFVDEYVCDACVGAKRRRAA